MNLEPSIPRRLGQQKHRDGHPGATAEAYFRQAVAIPLLDSLITEMKERYADQQHVASGAVKLVPSVMLTTEEKTWKTDVIKFAVVHRDSLPCWALLDEALEQWRLKWVGHQKNAGDGDPHSGSSVVFNAFRIG